MLLTFYTSYEEVRAALGVSEEELDDPTLDLPIYRDNLEEGLNDISSVLLATVQPLIEVADQDTLTAQQQRLVKLTRLYSAYYVAQHLLQSVELFGYLKVADGRASTERDPKAFENLTVNINGMLSRLAKRLTAALVDLVPTAPVPVTSTISYVSGVAGSSDPVLGA